MSRREDIDNAVWSDPDFSSLSVEGKLVYLWSFTNQRCGMAGIYKLAIPPAAAEIGMSVEALMDTFGELSQAGLAFYEEQVLWVRSRVKHLRSRSPQMAKSIAKDLEKLPAKHSLLARFLAEYGSDRWLRDDLPRPYADPMVNLSKKPIGKGDSHTLSVPSPEGPGQGQGSSTDRTDLSGTDVVVDHARTRVELPAEFPEELRPHLVAVFRTLRGLAERHNAKAVNALSLAQVVMARRHKPLVRSALDYAAWADSTAQRRKDVVAGYRRWLDRTDDLASPEMLGEDGLPAAGVTADVIPLASRKPNAGDKIRRIKAAEAAERSDVDEHIS